MTISFVVSIAMILIAGIAGYGAGIISGYNNAYADLIQMLRTARLSLKKVEENSEYEEFEIDS